MALREIGVLTGASGVRVAASLDGVLALLGFILANIIAIAITDTDFDLK